MVSVIADSPHCRDAWQNDENAAVQEDQRSAAAARAQLRLSRSGLGSIPEQLSTFQSMSNGQRQRANVAALLADGVSLDGFANELDEITSNSCANGGMATR